MFLSLSLVVNGMNNLFYISPHFNAPFTVPVLFNLLAVKKFAKEKFTCVFKVKYCSNDSSVGGVKMNTYVYLYIAKLQHVDPDIRQTDRQTKETGLHGLLGCLIIHMLWSLLGSARLCPVPASFGRSATQSLPCYSCHNSRSAAE